ncbi:MAG: trp operon repressor [Cellvibrionaceae bacterium]|nr:trp operon repressor [Cellvibrionaceae bacterium]
MNQKTNSSILIKILCQIEDKRDMAQFLELLFTEKEAKEIDNRLEIFRLLLQQNPQRDIASALGVGIATVTRGSQALARDSKGLLKRHLLKQVRNKTP